MTHAAASDATARRGEVWACGRFGIDLARPKIMGIVNVTPDSFSDGGRHFDTAAAIAHARRLVADGADIIDIGGESTRPGSEGVSLDEELRRVLPVVEAVAADGVPVSIDTSKPDVMRAALAAGAAIVNDVNALRAPGALAAVAPTGCGVVLMHMAGTPRMMQAAPHYVDVVAEVTAFLRDRAAAAVKAGIAAERIAVDPGFGFGKTVAHNYALLAHLARVAAPGYPLLVGVSNKSMLGAVTGRESGERLHATVAASLLAIERGARVVRVHEVAPMRDALAVWLAMHDAGRDGEERR